MGRKPSCAFESATRLRDGISGDTARFCRSCAGGAPGRAGRSSASAICAYLPTAKRSPRNLTPHRDLTPCLTTGLAALPLLRKQRGNFKEADNRPHWRKSLLIRGNTGISEKQSWHGSLNGRG